MTLEDFSNNFDVLLTTLAPSLRLTINEYEKSVALTRAQNNLVKAYLAKVINPMGMGYNASAITQMEFSTLVTTKNIDISSAGVYGGYTDTGYVVSFTDDDFKIGTRRADPLCILNERVTTILPSGLGASYVIVPIDHNEYNRILSRPYPEPLKRQAWRLFESDRTTLGRTVEIILRSDAGTPDKYVVRYIRNPRPIILTDLSDTSEELSIEGETAASECELSQIFHNDILNEAIRLLLSPHTSGSEDNKEQRNDS